MFVIRGFKGIQKTYCF